MQDIDIEQQVADQFLDNLKSLVGNRFVGLRYYSNSADIVKKYKTSNKKKHWNITKTPSRENAGSEQLLVNNCI